MYVGLSRLRLHIQVTGRRKQERVPSSIVTVTQPRKRPMVGGLCWLVKFSICFFLGLGLDEPGRDATTKQRAARGRAITTPLKNLKTTQHPKCEMLRCDVVAA